jgi:glycogen operon protein
MLATLFLSQGVPMLLMGDECRRTQGGNNNAYCQDNELSWFDWTLVRKYEELWRFCRELILFRRSEPTVRQRTFLRGLPHQPNELSDVSWYGDSGAPIDWGNDDEGIICVLMAPPRTDAMKFTARNIMILIHNGAAEREFTVPSEVRHLSWRFFIDTAAESPKDIMENGPAAPESGCLKLQGRSVVVFVSKD